jgi:hypothetical protein
VLYSVAGKDAGDLAWDKASGGHHP